MPLSNPFRRGYLPQIGRIHRSHTIGGANSTATTMVVMIVDCCVGCERYFQYYSYSTNPMGWEFFDPARTVIAVNLLMDVINGHH